MRNYQAGPDGSADLLADVVARISYKPDWTITLEEMRREGEHLAGGEGLTLRVRFTCADSTGKGGPQPLDHVFAVPPALYTRETWERWVLDCLVQMETHEAMEWFKVDGWAPFFPMHGTANGHNPYTIQRRHPGDGLPGAPAWPAGEAP
jgi:hypothetical protein